MVQNNDIQVRITIKDEAGVAYNITALNACEVYAYYLDGIDKKLFATYKISNTGLYHITVIDATNGIIEIILNREKTRLLTTGKIYLETRIRITATSAFISSLQNLGTTGVEIDTNETSANPNSLT